MKKAQTYLPKLTNKIISLLEIYSKESLQKENAFKKKKFSRFSFFPKKVFPPVVDIEEWLELLFERFDDCKTRRGVYRVLGTWRDQGRNR